MTRTERQKECIKRWIESGGRGIIVCPTGFGKTFLSIQLILALKKQKENIKVIVSVPSTNLKDQWDEYRIKNGLMNNIEIWVINSLIKEEHVCDLFIVDKKFVEFKSFILLGIY